MPFKKSIILSTEPLNQRQKEDDTSRYFDYNDYFTDGVNAETLTALQENLIAKLKLCGGGLFSVPLDASIYTKLIAHIGFPRISFCLFGVPTIEASEYTYGEWVDKLRATVIRKNSWNISYQHDGYITILNSDYVPYLSTYGE